MDNHTLEGKVLATNVAIKEILAAILAILSEEDAAKVAQKLTKSLEDLGTLPINKEKSKRLLNAKSGYDSTMQSFLQAIKERSE